ncbi:MAG TPA: hypothetical protein VES20_03885 [Bryobacteraceae bacterium]|nr:hypothetical protein [Bryobacteraceae bacterium]
MAIGNLAFGVFAIIVPLAVLLGYGGWREVWSQAEAFTGGGFVATGLGVLHVLVAVPCILGGLGLLRLQGWARLVVILASAVNLLIVPLGTCLGTYSLWALTQHESEPLFSEQAFRRRPGR